MVKKRRIDELLVALGLAPTLEAARAEVMAANVLVNEQRVRHASLKVPGDATVRLKKPHGRYVSRAGDKLANAVSQLGVAGTFVDAVVYDVGCATGGFSDFALQAGARVVVAIDIGHNVLAWKIRNDPRVTTMEQTDVRDVDPLALPAADWIVADISFAPLQELAPHLARLCRAHPTNLLVLVKPQFELPAAAVPEGGIVSDPARHEEALNQATDALRRAGLVTGIILAAAPRGRFGNQEFFIHARLP